jgi:hypothetical protein
MNNGRVDISQPNIDQFQLFLQPKQNITNYKDAMTGNWNDTILSKTFFSKGNIEIIQNGIRAGVYNKSNGRFIISPQNETNLKIIMRSIFLQYAKNNNNSVSFQITNLNKIVLDYCIKDVYSEAQSYIKYKNDVNTLAVPMSRPAYVNNKGDKVLELKKWF